MRCVSQMRWIKLIIVSVAQMMIKLFITKQQMHNQNLPPSFIVSILFPIVNKKRFLQINLVFNILKNYFKQFNKRLNIPSKKRNFGLVPEVQVIEKSFRRFILHVSFTLLFQRG